MGLVSARAGFGGPGTDSGLGGCHLGLGSSGFLNKKTYSVSQSRSLVFFQNEW